MGLPLPPRGLRPPGYKGMQHNVTQRLTLWHLFFGGLGEASCNQEPTQNEIRYPKPGSFRADPSRDEQMGVSQNGTRRFFVWAPFKPIKQRGAVKDKHTVASKFRAQLATPWNSYHQAHEAQIIHGCVPFIGFTAMQLPPFQEQAYAHQARPAGTKVMTTVSPTQTPLDTRAWLFPGAPQTKTKTEGMCPRSHPSYALLERSKRTLVP